jgi:hypothetical protein
MEALHDVRNVLGALLFDRPFQLLGIALKHFFWHLLRKPLVQLADRFAEVFLRLTRLAVRTKV